MTTKPCWSRLELPVLRSVRLRAPAAALFHTPRRSNLPGLHAASMNSTTSARVRNLTMSLPLTSGTPGILSRNADRISTRLMDSMPRSASSCCSRLRMSAGYERRRHRHQHLGGYRRWHGCRHRHRLRRRGRQRHRHNRSRCWWRGGPGQPGEECFHCSKVRSVTFCHRTLKSLMRLRSLALPFQTHGQPGIRVHVLTH